MLSLIITIIVLGLIAWAVSFIPLPAPFTQIIQVILIIVAIFYVISFVSGGSVPAFPIR